MAILTNPRLLLSDHPLGGGALSGEVRLAVGTRPDMLEAIMSVVEAANPTQRAAVAAGLASAALACVQTRPDVAGAIQARVATIGDPAFLLAFVSTTGGAATAATGFAGVGGSGGGGGGAAPALGTGFAPGNYGGSTFGPVDNQRSNLFSVVAGSNSDITSASARTTQGSVSPTIP